MSKHDVHFSSDKMDYGTPQWFFDFWNERYDFEMDVCANEKNFKMKPYLSEKEDALNKSWKKKRCWMNPPYGRDIEKWMKKAYEEACEGALVCCLVPSRTDTNWWHNYVMKGSTVYLIKGRIKFEGAPTGAPFPSAVVVLNMPQFSPMTIFDSKSLTGIKRHISVQHGVFQ